MDGRTQENSEQGFEAAPGDYSQLVVEVLVDLLGLAVLAEHAAQDAHAALPDELEGEPRVGGTPALSGTGVPALPVVHEKYGYNVTLRHMPRTKSAAMERNTRGVSVSLPAGCKTKKLC